MGTCGPQNTKGDAVDALLEVARVGQYSIWKVFDCDVRTCVIVHILNIAPRIEKRLTIFKRGNQYERVTATSSGASRVS